MDHNAKPGAWSAAAMTLALACASASCTTTPTDPARDASADAPRDASHDGQPAAPDGAPGTDGAVAPDAGSDAAPPADAGCVPSDGGAAPGEVRVSVDLGASDRTSQLDPGATHMQYSLDAWGDAASVARGSAVLTAAAHYQNQHIMGFGADNPEPSPGTYDWGSLDARMATIRATHGEPVITLCCAPDWMKGGTAGQTDWNQLEVAPLPSHFADFAALAAQVARRYPDVRYFQVWNELKGFFSESLNRWDYEGYTQLYNLVYDALHGVNPAIQVGGPYVVMDTDPAHSGSHPSALRGAYGTVDQRSLDVVTYWLAHKHGAEFIAFDGGSQTGDDGALFTATQFFDDVTTWVRGQTTLPIWWSEWYAIDGTPQHDHDLQNAVMTTAMIHMARAGAAVPLRWAPQGVDGEGYQGDDESMFSDTRTAGGGQAFPFAAASQALREHFGPGTALYPATSSSPDVAALASASSTLLVNQRASAVTVRVNGTAVMLAPHQVRLIDTPHVCP